MVRHDSAMAKRWRVVERKLTADGGRDSFLYGVASSVEDSRTSSCSLVRGSFGCLGCCKPIGRRQLDADVMRSIFGSRGLASLEVCPKKGQAQLGTRYSKSISRVGFDPFECLYPSVKGDGLVVVALDRRWPPISTPSVQPIDQIQWRFNEALYWSSMTHFSSS